MIIRDAIESDLHQIASVHYHSWLETYLGMIDPKYLETRSIEKSINVMRPYLDKIIVAIVDNKIVGIASYNQDRENCGEITGIYVLKQYQKRQIGRKLMEACENKMKNCNTFYVWVLKENIDAQQFYHHLGYQYDGSEQKYDVKLTILDLVKMVKKR